MEAINLFTLQEQIKRVLALNFPEPLFIKAEISRLNISRGHYYLELADKGLNDEHLKAKAQAVIWKGQVAQMKNNLKGQFDELLQEGLQIAFHAQVQYHEIYGLKLLIQDIDLEYSLGVVAREREEILKKLEAEGLLPLNSKRALPSVIQNIAIISSPTAAGYGDFIDTIQDNPFQLKIGHTLFPSAMQGLSVESEIIDQLQKIDKAKSEFDLAVIIRGGGGKLDLAYFDNYNIGKIIAELKLPVLTGIGHQIDETVTDRVAHSSFKTPTAVAEFIIQHNLKFLQDLQQLKTMIGNRSRQIIESELWSIRSFKKEVLNLSDGKLQQHQRELQFTKKELRSQTRQLIDQEFLALKHLSESANLLDPQKVLSRGYTAIEQDQKRIFSKEKFDSKKNYSLIFSDGIIEIEKND